MSQLARIAVVETRVKTCEQNIAAIPARFDKIDARLRQVELLVASGIGALALLQLFISYFT